jgi:ABC-type glutathione transport system ATPase component
VRHRGTAATRAPCTTRERRQIPPPAGRQRPASLLSCNPNHDTRGENGWDDVLELKGLTRRYGDLVALDDLSFTVAEGQLFGFVGPNGAGKTTAMRIILGVLEPDAGEVRWRGRRMTDEIRKRLGYLPEEHGQTFSTQCAQIRGTAAANPLPGRPADSTPTNRSALSLR